MMKLQRWIEDLEDKEWGYVRTKTPLMAKSDLYKISGHWDHYLDGMFVLGDPEKDGEQEVMALRPMTCPFQYYVYKAKQHSYRDLPYRMSETSTLFRNEDSGEMHGLTRVRQFTISEGHNVILFTVYVLGLDINLWSVECSLAVGLNKRNIFLNKDVTKNLLC